MNLVTLPIPGIAYAGEENEDRENESNNKESLGQAVDRLTSYGMLCPLGPAFNFQVIECADIYNLELTRAQELELKIMMSGLCGVGEEFDFVAMECVIAGQSQWRSDNTRMQNSTS